jgi:hypothetical protein
MIPGLPGSQVKNEGDIMRFITDIQRDIRELRAQNILATAGITTQPDGITVGGTLNVSGSETVTGSIDVQGPATFEGTTTIGGNASITGTLALPAGIIGNDALTAPVVPLATHAGANNFGLATGPNVDIVSTTINVPAGYTQALVFATATMHAYNNGTSDDAYLGVSINGLAMGASSQDTVGASNSSTIPATKTNLLTGLGASFPVSANASSSAHAWAANTVNFVNLDVMTIFLR